LNPDRIASSKNVFPAGLRVFCRPVSSAEVPLRFVRALIVLVLIQFAAGVTPTAGASAGLPTAATLKLRHLEETYRLLDVAAARIWPGCADYRKVPFMFGFENSLRVPVGHPNPPAGFEVAAGLKCADRSGLSDQGRCRGGSPARFW
jgi:hypothetical protein